MNNSTFLVFGVVAWYLYNRFASGEGGMVYMPTETYNSEQEAPIVTSDDAVNYGGDYAGEYTMLGA